MRLIDADKLGKSIAGHSKYSGDSILARIYCMAEGKEIDKSITPLDEERPKGKWIIDDFDEYNRRRIWKCHCSICDKNPLDYVSGTENWWIYKKQMPKYCPKCGEENEVE